MAVENIEYLSLDKKCKLIKIKPISTMFMICYYSNRVIEISLSNETGLCNTMIMVNKTHYRDDNSLLYM